MPRKTVYERILIGASAVGLLGLFGGATEVFILAIPVVLIAGGLYMAAS